MNVLEQQITEQIEQKITVTVFHGDDKISYMSLYQQSDDHDDHWIAPAFNNARQISKTKFNEIVTQFTNEQQFNTDNEVVRTNLSMQCFYDRYYNQISPDYPETGYTPANLRHWITQSYGRTNAESINATAKKLDVSVDAVTRWLSPTTAKRHRDMPYLAWVELTQS